MSKQKILTIAVIVLVIMNIGTLSFIWMSKSGNHKHKSKKKRPNVESYLTRKLSLSESQVDAFKMAREQHFEQTHELKQSLHADRKSLSQLLSDQDTIQQQKLLTHITHKNIEIEKLNFIHLQNLRSLCTEEQKLEFDSVIFKVIDKGAGLREGRKPHKSKK